MSQETANPGPWKALLKDLPPDQVNAVLASIRGMLKEAVTQSVPPVFDSVLKRLGYTEEVVGLVHLLAARSNDSKENVLLKALTLYGLGLDAREKGNRLVILNSDDEILHEVEGFDTVEEAHSQAAV